jgi:hypothetical protein
LVLAGVFYIGQVLAGWGDLAGAVICFGSVKKKVEPTPSLEVSQILPS